MVLATTAFAAAAQARTLYAVGPSDSAVNSNLYTIDPSTGIATLVGDMGIRSVGGIAFGPDGTLFASSTSSFYKVDPITATAVRIGSLGFTSPEGDLAFQPTTGILFGASSTLDDQLITINTATGAATKVGPLGSIGRDTSGIAFRADGTLFGVSLRDTSVDQFISINPSTGAATAVGPTGTNILNNGMSVGGLAFDPNSATLYFAGVDQFYTINTVSGTATLIGSTGVTEISGLAFAPLPEPGSLAAAGLLALVLRWRRRGAQGG